VILPIYQCDTYAGIPRNDYFVSLPRFLVRHRHTRPSPRATPGTEFQNDSSDVGAPNEHQSQQNCGGKLFGVLRNDPRVLGRESLEVWRESMFGAQCEARGVDVSGGKLRMAEGVVSVDW
jgi:hypothetical protein